MQQLFIDKEIKYTGTQLTPHWIYKNYNLLRDAIVAFVGEVEVDTFHMVDIEDVINNEPIYSKEMLNFIIECFEVPLEQVVLMQRMLICTIKEALEKRGFKLLRFGDDLFFEDKKLTVSIATKATTSCLIHTGINIKKENAPISVSCLEDFPISDIKEFALEVMKNYTEEIDSIKKAVCKVRGV